MTLLMLDLPDDKRVALIESEMYSKGHCYVAEDMVRRQLIVIGQRMVHIQSAIEEHCGEVISLASLFESATLKLRKGTTKSFRVVRMPPSDVPKYLDERRAQFDKLVIAASNADKWQLQSTVC